MRAGLLFTGSAELEGGWVLARDGLIEQVGSGAPPSADQTLRLDNCVGCVKPAEPQVECRPVHDQRIA